MPHNRTPAPFERLVVASANSGKLREFRSLFEGLPFGLTGLAELALPSPVESGSSFLENATLKARHAANLSGCAAVADDSGLEVDALGGAPGLFSARYAGAGAGDAENNAKLLRELGGLALEERRARYRCVLVLMTGPQDAAPLVTEGVWEGFILDTPRGQGGFGYDPYFWLPSLKLTAAELDLAVKNRHSHRGMAMRAMRELLQARAWPALRARPAVRP
jgi:XTP/dITP diphosphohydrolase